MHENLPIIGWREWVGLPELGIKKLKAKIDTGARTSALHAFELEAFRENNQQYVRFAIHPLQYKIHKVVYCVAPIKDIRWVTDSGGHKEERYVIETPIMIGPYTWPIEITLTNRDTMAFRMLLGRTALRKRFWIDLMASYTNPKPQ